MHLRPHSCSSYVPKQHRGFFPRDRMLLNPVPLMTGYNPRRTLLPQQPLFVQLIVASAEAYKYPFVKSTAGFTESHSGPFEL